MKQEPFEQRHSSQWQKLESILDQLDKPQFRRQQVGGDAEFPALYRLACHHFALARQRHYSPHLTGRLHHLVWRGHMQLYRRDQIRLSRVLAFIAQGFPRLVRQHYAVGLLAAGLFLLPMVLIGLSCYQDDGLIYTMMGIDQVAQLETMYDPANRMPGREEARQSDSDMMMFGFYIRNNIGIGFRTFAGGLFYGLGSAFFLLFNGLHIGAAAGHLTQLGYGVTFWHFVCGHSAFELTAIVISGMAGFVLAQSLFAPGSLSRIEALKAAAGESIQLMIGAAVLFLVAAFFEAFWSPLSLAPVIKYPVAALLWGSVFYYFARVGRRRDGD